MMPSAAKRIVKNTSFLIMPEFVNLGLQLVFTIIMARWLGSSDFGMFYFALAFVQLFHSFSELGIWTILVRDVAQFREQRLFTYVNNAVPLRACLALLTYGLMVLVITFSSYSADVKQAVYILGVGTGLSTVVRIYLAAFRAFENMKYEGCGAAVLSIVYTSVGVPLLLKGYGIAGLAIANLLGDICHAVYVASAYKRVFKCRLLQFEMDLQLWKYLLIAGLPLGISKVFTFVESKIDVILLSLIRSPVEVGWYSAARRICDMLRAFPTAFYGSLFPLWSNYFRSDMQSLQDTSVKTYRFMIFLALPIAVVFTILPDKILTFLLGAEYVPAYYALRVLGWLVVISYVGTAFGSLLISSDNCKTFTVIIGIQLVTTILLSLLLGPAFGATGISIAVVMSHGLNTLLCYLMVSKKLFSFGLFRNAITTVCAGAVMGAIVLLFRQSSVFLLLPLAAVSYLLSFYLINDLYKPNLALANRSI